MNIFDNYLYCIKNYAKFDGRARRSEYWLFLLCNILIFIVLAMVMSLLPWPSVAAIVIGIYVLAMIVPLIAVIVRRLHDIGKPGTYIFIRLIPLVGGIWSFVLMVTDSQPGTNQYGLNPKGIGNIDNNDELIKTIGE